MRFSSILTLLPALVNGAIAASVTTPPRELVFLGVHPISESKRVAPPTNSSSDHDGGIISISDSCYSSNFNIQRSDITSLRQNLQNSNSGALTNLPHLNWVGWTWGTALLCIYNDYVFDNTHISRWEAGWVTGYIQDTCFYTGSGICQGGSATCSGDTGLSLRAVLYKSGNENC